MGEPALHVRGVQAGREAAVLQRPELGRRAPSRGDDVIEVEAQGGVVLVSPLVLRGGVNTLK